MRRLALAAALLLAASGLAAASHDNGTGGRSLGGRTLPQDQAVLLRLEAEAFSALANGSAVSDAGATGGKAWKLTKYGQISFEADVPTTGVVWLQIRARGEHPPGLMTTHMHPVVDGEQRGEWDVGPTWATFRQSIPVLAGRHVFSVDNFNNYHAPADDRTLVVDWIELSVPFTDGAPRIGKDLPAWIDGPVVHEAGTGMARLDDAGAHNETSWHMWGIGCFGELVVAEAAGTYRLDARLRGNAPDGTGSRTSVVLNGVSLLTTDVGEAWENVETDLTLAAGANVLRICYDNDYGGAQKRNLWMDEMRITPIDVSTAPPVASPTPPSATATPATPSPPAPASPTPTEAPPDDEPPTPPSATPTPTVESTARVPAPAWIGLAALAVALALRRR